MYVNNLFIKYAVFKLFLVSFMSKKLLLVDFVLKLQNGQFVKSFIA